MLNSVSFLNGIAHTPGQKVSTFPKQSVGLDRDVFQKTSNIAFKGLPSLEPPVKTTIIAKRTGEQLDAVIKFCDDEGKDKLKLVANKLLMGEVTFINMPKHPYYGLFENKDYVSKGCIFVTLIDSNFRKKYAQVGTRLMQEIVRRSLKEGHEGRVILQSTNGSSPFYHKLGFKPYLDPEGRCTKAIIDKINNPKKYSFLDNAIVEMYLPEENAAKLLAK
ncbi:MAG: GNAT family N-acetyltransferase [Candidatus Gastranaerophilales bacterium]|nr:GNAT family N-acetyltransferase [Candidatus Gastranaerophilales bacterium]